MQFKIEVQDDAGVWSDVQGDDGKILIYNDEGAARAALAEPEVQKRFVEQGWIAGGAAPAEVDGRLRREAATWKAIVERTGVKVE